MCQDYGDMSRLKKKVAITLRALSECVAGEHTHHSEWLLFSKGQLRLHLGVPVAVYLLAGLH